MQGKIFLKDRFINSSKNVFSCVTSRYFFIDVNKFELNAGIPTSIVLICKLRSSTIHFVHTLKL